MEEISSRIWDGMDYIPGVFDEWVADEEGEFTAVLLDGALVGCAKLTYLAPAHAWLEGLRKDPRVREPGLARAATRHLLARVAARPGVASVRFSTYLENRASMAANEALGFRRIAVLSRKAWEGSAADCARLPLLTGEEARREVGPVADAGAVRAYLEGSGYLAASGGMLVDGWRALPPVPECIDSRCAAGGACRGVWRGGRLAGLCISGIDRAAGRAVATVACLDAEDGGIINALFDDLLLRLAADGPAAQGPRGPSGHGAAAPPGGSGTPWRSIEWMVPELPRLARLCAARGLASDLQERDFFVYGLPLERLAEAAG
jgi:hypothetical protein